MSETVSKQYASRLGGYSSEYGAKNSASYVVSNILKEPNLYPQYGDFTQACVLRTYGPWWKIAPEYQKPLPNQSSRYFTSDDYIELILDKKVYIQSVNIFETYNPGAVVRILALDQSMTKFTKRWFVMWELKDGQVPKIEPGDSVIFHPKIKVPPFPSKVIRLEFIHDQLDYYTELDAVQVIGETDVDVDSDRHVSSIMSQLTLDSSTNTTAAYTSVASDNGYFDLLPSEILFAILCYLSVDELSILSTVSSLFHENCYSPLLQVHQHLNLQPYWYRISEHSMMGFFKKCTQLCSLNLSWCGAHNDLFESESINRLLEPCKLTLTRLDLACCPLTDDSLRRILTYCPALKALDVSSTATALSCTSLLSISTLHNLTRLNLYLTSIDTASIVEIVRKCQMLETINLGSCSYIDNFDQVVTAISECCANIKHLDLWRARTLTSVGLCNLASRSKYLESLDIGWCTKLYADEGYEGDGCIMMLAVGCPRLKKLNLTANRSITDRQLRALTEHCPLLEQLDLLGNRGVTKDAIDCLLKYCKRMIFLDLSFCADITLECYTDLQRHYPNCSIKKSFTH